MWALYRLATLLLGLPWALYLRLRHGGTLAERLGALASRGDRPVWIQAVSVGEVRLGLRLRAALEAQGLPCLLTATTATGLTLAGREGAGAHPFPADVPGAFRRALRRARPRLVVLVETELWPGLLRAAAREGVPVVVANARLSDRSLGRTLRFRGAFGGTLAALTVAAQTEEHGRRFEALCVPPHRIRVTGNMKYDLEPPAAFAAQREALLALAGEAGFLWTAGSVREGEEEAVLRAHAALKESAPGVRLIAAPRHLDRAQRCLEVARGLGLRAVRRSEARAGEPWDLLVLDTMGELWAAYSVAALAFVGGSLVPLGGQNILEPAYLGVPSLFGPSMENFEEEARRLTLAGAAVQVASREELVTRLEQLMGDPAARAEMGRLGQGVVAAYRGAVARTAHLVMEVDGRRPTDGGGGRTDDGGRPTVDGGRRTDDGGGGRR